MSDSDNYFSDSEKSANDENNEETQSLDSEYEMDEESLRIIYAAAKKNRNDIYEAKPDESVLSKKLSKKNKKERKKKNLSLGEFNDEVENSKPKKWSSKRFDDKKKSLGIGNFNISKRCFNPRLPVPNINTFKTKKFQKEYSGDEDDFPELDIEV